MGSDANAVVRRRIEDELRAIGLQPQHRRHAVCGGSACGWVDNLVARIDGQSPGPAVLIACHYDSVPAGPGVGDDGSGVGIALEVARALQAGPPPRHPIIILIDDGEEAGLFGARGFVQDDPWAKGVAVVVNVEARGTTGVSSMFETKGATRWMLEPYLERAPRPRVSSLATTIYERMPNNTDLTVFGEAGMAGLNFAFVGGGGRYHTPRDDLEHLSWGSVQHQGAEALAAAGALANLDLTASPQPDEDVFETLCGVVVRWPRPWSLGLALTCLLVTLSTIGAGAYTGRLRIRGLIVSIVGLLAVLVTTLAVLWLVTTAADVLRPLPVRFSSVAATHTLGWWLLLAAGVVAGGSVLARFVRGVETLGAFALGGAAAAVGIAGVLPGGSGAPVVVAALMAVGLVAATLGPNPWVRVAGLATATVVPSAIAMELSLALQDTFGSGVPLAPCAVVALAGLGATPWALAIAPGRASLRVGFGLLFVGTLVTAIGSATLDYDRDNPYPVDLVLVRPTETSSARWWAMSFNGPPPPTLTEAGFGPGTEPLLYGYPAYPGPGSDLPAVDGLTIEDVHRPADAAGTVRGRLRSARGSTAGQLQIGPPEVLRSIKIDGRLVAGRRVSTDAGPAVAVRLHGLPSEGVPIEIETSDIGRLRVDAVDVGFGLPASAETDRWTATRPHWAGPLQFGDVDLVLSRIEL